MKESIKKLFADKILFWTEIISIMLILLSLIVVFIFYRQLPPVIPIFNQYPWGEMQLGEKGSIFIPIGLAFAIYIVDMVFSSYIYIKMPLVSRMLCVTSLFISFFLLLFIVRTILVIV